MALIPEFVIQNIHWFYVVISAFTTLALVFGDWDFEASAYLHAGVSFWSGLIYLNFIYEVFPVGLTPYADWILSTPLIILAFGLSVEKEITSRLAYATLSQMAVIVFGLLSVAFGMNLFFFALSTVAMVIMLSLVFWITFEEYPQLYVLLTATWIAYPIIFVLYGGKLAEATLPLIILPLFSKHLFSIIHSSRAE